jgi:hypothetical protein
LETECRQPFGIPVPFFLIGSFLISFFHKDAKITHHHSQSGDFAPSTMSSS